MIEVNANYLIDKVMADINNEGEEVVNSPGILSTPTIKVKDGVPKYAQFIVSDLSGNNDVHCLLDFESDDHFVYTNDKSDGNAFAIEFNETMRTAAMLLGTRVCLVNLDGVDYRTTVILDIDVSGGSPTGVRTTISPYGDNGVIVDYPTGPFVYESRKNALLKVEGSPIINSIVMLNGGDMLLLDGSGLISLMNNDFVHQSDMYLPDTKDRRVPHLDIMRDEESGQRKVVLTRSTMSMGGIFGDYDLAGNTIVEVEAVANINLVEQKTGRILSYESL